MEEPDAPTSRDNPPPAAPTDPDSGGPGPDDAFTLWDLRVQVVEGDRPMGFNHQPGVRP